LQHPNEYIRGVTLRFLCRIREEEILEPLVPSILANLDHRCGMFFGFNILCHFVPELDTQG
jgi:vesicle coat complex subunit